MAAGFNFALHPTALAQVLPLSIVSIIDANPSAPSGLAAPLNNAEVRLLAATAWGEARSEGEDGMRAVAHVIVNRVDHGFGSDIETVVRAPRQFSVWNRRDPNRRRVENPDAYARSGADLETWEIAQRVAREVLAGQSTDPTHGALFYHTTAIRPWWSRFGEGRRVIGAHVFYDNVRGGGRAASMSVAADRPVLVEPLAPALDEPLEALAPLAPTEALAPTG
jgi:spore germination cell wall hydrolase CwlJ-like protein